MKNRRIFCLVLSLLCPFFMLCQNVTITGSTNVPDALVRLLAYDDMMTRRQTQLVETHADKDGNFVLKAVVNEITPVDIAIGLERVDLIICPNATYDIRINVSEMDEEASYFETEPPTMYINTIDDGGFYAQYLQSADIVDQFIYENIDRILRERNLKLLDDVDSQIKEQLGEIKFKYVNDLVKYSKASVMLAVNKKKVLAECFDNHEVLYLHPTYMMVFHDVFQNDIKDNDFLSRNPQLAEFIRLYKIKNSFESNLCDKQTTLKVIDDILKTSKYQKNKDVATSIAKMVNDMTYDSEAPYFSLKDKNGKTVQLTDYQNSMVLLQFVDRYTPLNGHEFPELNELHKQWNDTVQIVTIATAETFQKYVQLFDSKGYKWPLLNLGDNILLIEKYHVRMFPAYVILKKKGRVGMSPAPSPDHELDKHVRRISKYL